MEFTDSKLDGYIAKIKNPETSNSDVLITYKKATKRIEILKTKYNKINSSKKKSSDSESDEGDVAKLSIEELLSELSRIRTALESENTDINDLIKLYAKYNSLVGALKTENTDLQNKFYKVDSNKKDIVVSKVDLETLIN
jgi:hypothetical protein